jgi:hypothetical protein
MAWPLHSNHTCSVTATSLLHSILDWLRAGYPEGVPGPDRVPLLALLRATPLTEEQIKEVVRNITADGSADTADAADGEIGEDEIAAFIKDVSHHDAGPDNVQRVAAKLAAAGWPLAGVGDGSV